MAIITATLFRYLIEMPKLENKILSVKEKVFERQYLQRRLDTIFSSIVPLNKLPKEIQKQHQAIYSLQFLKERDPSLIFFYDNGVDIDPSFSGPVLGRVFLDTNQMLTLATWPLKEKNAYRKEILFSNLASYKFYFFTKESEKETGKYSWIPFLEKSKKRIPSMIKLGLEENSGKTIEFAFFLPLANDTIDYPKDMGAL